MIVFRSRHQGHHFLSLTTNHREPPLYGSSCDSGSLRPSLGRTWWAVKRATSSARSVGNSHRSTESAPACKSLRSPLCALVRIASHGQLVYPLGGHLSGEMSRAAPGVQYGGFFWNAWHPDEGALSSSAPKK
jgi:hypothetical protein